MKLVRSILIQRPVADVFAFVCDPKNLPAWQPTVQDVRPPDGPIGLGSTFGETRQLGPLHTKATVEVTGFERDRAFDLRATGGPIPVEIRHAFDDEGGATRLTLTVEGHPRGAMRIAAAAIARQIEHAAEADLARLKALLEDTRPHEG